MHIRPGWVGAGRREVQHFHLACHGLSAVVDACHDCHHQSRVIWSLSPNTFFFTVWVFSLCRQTCFSVRFVCSIVAGKVHSDVTRGFLSPIWEIMHHDKERQARVHSAGLGQDDQRCSMLVVMIRPDWAPLNEDKAPHRFFQSCPLTSSR